MIDLSLIINVAYEALQFASWYRPFLNQVSFFPAFSSRWNSGAHVARDLLPIEQHVHTIRRSILRRPCLSHVLYQRSLPSPDHVRLSHYGDHSDGDRGAAALPDVVLCATSARHQEERRQNQRVFQVLPGKHRAPTLLMLVPRVHIVSSFRW